MMTELTPEEWEARKREFDESLEATEKVTYINGAKPEAPKEDKGAYELRPVEDFLVGGKPPEYIVDGLFETGAVIGIVAPPESGKSLLVQEIAVCVGMGRDFHGRKTRQGLVVYLVGEGQHGLRARFQALGTRHDMRQDIVALGIATSATSLIEPLEVMRVQAAIAAQVERYQMPLSLLIIDTLARFMSPGDESKAQDMGAYLQAVDYLRGDAAAITLHHPGHGDATRGRGSSSWRAALDTEYSLAKDGDIVTVTCQKMKDGQRPDPFSFKLVQAQTKMSREDGSPVMSALLESTEYQPAKRELSGKAQKTLLLALASQPQGSVWTETDMRKIGIAAGLKKPSAISAVLSLRQLGYFIPTVGGVTLKP